MEIENKMFLIPEACIKCSWSHVYTSLVCFRYFAKNEDTTENQAAAAYSLGQNTWWYKILFNWNCVKGSEINAKWNETLSQEDLRLSLVTGKEFLRKRTQEENLRKRISFKLRWGWGSWKRIRQRIAERSAGS